MSQDPTHWDAVAARALSRSCPIVSWPPRLDARIHANSGYPWSSWSADVRAVVDDSVAVLLVTGPPDPTQPYYTIRLRKDFEAIGYHYGPLPREMVERR